LSILKSIVPFDKEFLSDDDKQEIIRYCIHDVDATESLYYDRLEYIQSKLELAKMFNISPFKALKCTNAKLCSIILKADYIEREPDNKYILPDKIKNYIYENLPQSVIMQFSELNTENKTVELFENEIVFGIGGIHSTCGDDIFTKSDDEYALVNVDVTSYYPNLIMHFGYMSRNAKEPEVYERIYHLRTTIKKQAKDELAEHGKTEKYYQLHYLQNGLKLILNTTYGATKNKYNALYDEYQASSLCYTGQLLLAALANKLYTSIPNLKIIQTNTDGILVKCPRTQLKSLEILVHDWETMCGFYMEFDYIDSFLQRNVNNYIENTGNVNDPYKLKGK
jgi:DNA polymerase elongation subunit (family B)